MKIYVLWSEFHKKPYMEIRLENKQIDEFFKGIKKFANGNVFLIIL